MLSISLFLSACSSSPIHLNEIYSGHPVLIEKHSDYIPVELLPAKKESSIATSNPVMEKIKSSPHHHHH